MSSSEPEGTEQAPEAPKRRRSSAPTAQPDSVTVTEIQGEAPATNVVEAWRRVQRDMPSVGKDNRMSEGGGYNFRSIEQFTGHASVLMARHGVVVFPIGMEIEYVDFGTTKNGAKIVEARGKWDWLICGPGGPEDRIMATSFGQGRDTSDKGANKAATAAFKYLLMPALMISDRKDDPDHERIEDDVQAPPPPPTEEELRLKRIEDKALSVRQRNGAEGPYTVNVRTEAGGGTRADIQKWIAADPDAAEYFLDVQIEMLDAADLADQREAEAPSD